MSWKNRKNLDGNLDALEKHLRDMERDQKGLEPCPWCDATEEACDCYDAAAEDAYEMNRDGAE